MEHTLNYVTMSVVMCSPTLSKYEEEVETLAHVDQVVTRRVSQREEIVQEKGVMFKTKQVSEFCLGQLNGKCQLQILR